MSIEQYFRNRTTSNDIRHHCNNENRIYKLELEMSTNKEKHQELKNEFTELKKILDTNMKSINAKFFTVMGTSIIILLGALGTLVFFLLTK